MDTVLRRAFLEKVLFDLAFGLEPPEAETYYIRVRVFRLAIQTRLALSEYKEGKLSKDELKQIKKALEDADNEIESFGHSHKHWVRQELRSAIERIESELKTTMTIQKDELSPGDIQYWEDTLFTTDLDFDGRKIALERLGQLIAQQWFELSQREHWKPGRLEVCWKLRYKASK